MKKRQTLFIILVASLLVWSFIKIDREAKSMFPEDYNEWQEEMEDVVAEEPEMNIGDLHLINIEQRWIEPIENASKEFGVDPLLIYGIANAESGLGKYFYNEYDRDNCHNLWGLKGGNTKERIAKGESYIRCFNDEVAGARTVAKTLRLYYLDEGRDTPEKICEKWVGGKYADTHCPVWVANVNKILK